MALTAGIAALGTGASIASNLGNTALNNSFQNQQRLAREKAFTDAGLPSYLAYSNGNFNRPDHYQHAGGNTYLRLGYYGESPSERSTPEAMFNGRYMPYARQPRNNSSSSVAPDVPSDPPPPYSPPQVNSTAQNPPPSPSVNFRPPPNYGQLFNNRDIHDIKRMYWNTSSQ